MYQILIRRLLLVVPTLLVVSILSFAIMRAAPGDPVQMYVAGEMSKGSAEDIERIRENLGLNDPLPVQYLRWLQEALHGNLGYSISSHRPVVDLIAERVPASLSLMGISLILSMVVGITVGALAAVKQYSFFDYATTTFAVFGNALPSFWIGMILIWLFAVQLGWLPTGQMQSFMPRTRSGSTSPSTSSCPSLSPLSSASSTGCVTSGRACWRCCIRTTSARRGRRASANGG